jgi:hypothetical protein
MQKDDRIRLQHMLDAANEALSFIRSRIRADLDNDRMLVCEGRSEIDAEKRRQRSPLEAESG